MSVWEMDVGTWDIDAERSSAQVLSGAYSVLFPAASAAGKLITKEFIPVNNGRPYRRSIGYYASRANPGDNVSYGTKEYDKDKAIVLVSESIGTANGAAAWELKNTVIGSFHVNTRYIKPIFGKSGAGFDLYVDHYTYREVPLAFGAWASGATALGNGVFTKVLFATETHDHGRNFAGSTFTAPWDGLFHFDTAVTIVAAVQDTPVTATYYVNAAPSRKILTMELGGVAASNPTVGGSADIPLLAGDAVEVYCYQAAGAARNTSAAQADTWFNGHEITIP